MTDRNTQLLASLQRDFPDEHAYATAVGQVVLEVDPERLPVVARQLRDRSELAFEQLIDICGVDYLHYRQAEWTTQQSTATGFSRGVEARASGRMKFGVDYGAGQEPDRPRFAVVHQLLSVRHNRRLRLKVFAPDNDAPAVPSVVDVWPSADWFEREAFDLFGILFDGHPDLRRILTDYGFIGHPFRKDFPLSGNVEVRYDPERGRVVYQPVTIEPRVLAPKVIRDDYPTPNRRDEQIRANAEQAAADSKSGNE